jgi:phage shock protein A
MSLFGFHKHREEDPLEGASPAEIELYFMLTHIIKRMEQIAMAVSAEVQTVLDEIKQTKSLAQSVDAGVKLMQGQITDLQNQIAALQAGTVLSAEDKAALVQGAQDLADTNTSLQSDIPANTGGTGGTGATGA